MLHVRAVPGLPILSETVEQHDAAVEQGFMEVLGENLNEWNFDNRLAKRDFKGRQLPASSDPHILARRVYAAKWWLDGLSGPEVELKVNAWLEEQGKPPVSLACIRHDRTQLWQEWEADYEHSSAELRLMHMASLQRMKSLAMDQAESLKGKPGAAAYIRVAVQCEDSLAKLDGSLKRAEIRATSEVLAESGQSIKRVYEFVEVKRPAEIINQLPDEGVSEEE